MKQILCCRCETGKCFSFSVSLGGLRLLIPRYPCPQTLLHGQPLPRLPSTPRGSLQSALPDAQSQPRAGIPRESLAGSSRQGSGALGRTLNLSSEPTTLQTRSQLSQLLCQAAEEGLAFGAGTAAPPRAMWATRHGMPGTAKSSSSLCCSISSPPRSPRCPRGHKKQNWRGSRRRGQGEAVVMHGR